MRGSLGTWACRVLLIEAISEWKTACLATVTENLVTDDAGLSHAGQAKRERGAQKKVGWITTMKVVEGSRELFRVEQREVGPAARGRHYSLTLTLSLSLSNDLFPVKTGRSSRLHVKKALSAAARW